MSQKRKYTTNFHGSELTSSEPDETLDDTNEPHQQDNTRSNDVASAIERHANAAHANLDKLREDLGWIQISKDVRHAQEIANLNAELEKEQNERFNLAKQFEEYKKGVEAQQFNKNENETVANVSTKTPNNYPMQGLKSMPAGSPQANQVAAFRPCVNMQANPLGVRMSFYQRLTTPNLNCVSGQNVISMPTPQSVPNHQTPLTSRMLASLSAEDQKQELGERLLPRVKRHCPGGFAEKITGMMLEMDNSEILMVLENEGVLKDKVNQAVAVLQALNFGA